MNPSQTKRWRILRRCLVGLAVCLTLIGLFYTEENWRGKRAWDNCKRALQAQGVNFDWNAYIPAPVPENENVFGVPEMQQWFTGRGSTDLSKKMVYLGYSSTNTERLTVAELTIGLPGTNVPSQRRASILQWGDPRAKPEAERLIKDTLGPVATHPVGYSFMLRSPEETRPAQIFLQCQIAPTEKELLQFLPQSIASTSRPDTDKIQIEPTGSGSYKVTISALDTVAEYLKWSGQLEPEFALMRKALQRPCMRMNGDYSAPYEVPIPSFLTVRSTVQTLTTMARCHLLQEKPEQALNDLTLMHDLCRIDTNRPITLVGAMINVAVSGLYTATIADGLRWQAWREPQLAALEEQLKPINLLLPVKQASEMERVAECHILATEPLTRVAKYFFNAPGKASSWKDREDLVLAGLTPRGWAYQNAVALANLLRNAIASLDPAGQIVFPDKARSAADQEAHALSSHSSPYTFIAVQMIPNYSRVDQTTARHQTMLNQALIACALERFRLAHGQYPDSLDALAPQFIAAIPHDVIGGQPPHYRRAAGGTFMLYSVGWDGRDNGGVPGKTAVDGDWVWPVFP
jgi:hypothetical protein